MTTAWTAEHVCRIDHGRAMRVSPVSHAERSGLDPARLYWDMWPVQDPDGYRIAIGGRELWMALASPDRGDPALRHFEARIHLLERDDAGWRDLGPVLPSADMPYEREWAGSAVMRGDRITLHFTAAGTDRRPGGYQQQLWEASARLGTDGLPGHWTRPEPSIDGYGSHYMPADKHEGEAGRIKAFRDPAWFRDPADGREYLAFTASVAGSRDPFNGAFGLAMRASGGWRLLPPLITADGVNNELERAHLVFHGGRYYAFWSTQSATFAPGLRAAPNGLYGMVSDRLLGEYRPLNGSGLVLANPAAMPAQTYSWYVDASLTVCSFVDMWHPGGQAEARFGGVPAPLLQLVLDGDRCDLAGS